MEADIDGQSMCKGFNLPDEPSIGVFSFGSMGGD